jgi:hypothetical protein
VGGWQDIIYRTCLDVRYVTSPRRLWRTYSLGAPSLGRSDTRSSCGYDPHQVLPRLRMTSRNGGRWWCRPPLAICARALCRLSCFFLLLFWVAHQAYRSMSIIMLIAWWIWKHRNAAVFDNARPLVTSLFDDIMAEARQWSDAGPGMFTNCSPRIVSFFLGRVVWRGICPFWIMYI